jgi:hypothetical protein
MGSCAIGARSAEAAASVSMGGGAVGARSVQRLSCNSRHIFIRGWNQTRQSKRILARWPAMVGAKVSGADTVSRSWTGTKTHLQKVVRGTPTCQFLNALSVYALCTLISVCALRYCPVCAMS